MLFEAVDLWFSTSGIVGEVSDEQLLIPEAHVKVFVLLFVIKFFYKVYYEKSVVRFHISVI